jgi:hypothetical protein
MSIGNVTQPDGHARRVRKGRVLVLIAVAAGGVAAYADWAWWVGPAIGAAAGLVMLTVWARKVIPAMSDPFVRLTGLVIGAVFYIGLFGALPYGMYALVRWLVG